jgi:drug/metabolite transporter (DMT)-like permease
LLGIIFAILCAAFFAANYIFIQLGMKKSPNDNGVFINIIINVLVLGLLYLVILIIRNEPIAWGGTAIVAFITAGLLTTLLGRSALFAGIRRIGSSRSAALKNAAPIFTIVIAVLFLDESISLLSGIGIFFILFGLFLLAYEQWKKNGSAKQKDQVWMGLLFAGLAAFLFGTGQAVRKIGLLAMPDPILGAWIGTIVALLAYTFILLAKRQLTLTIVDQVKNFNIHYLFAGFATSFGILTFFMSAYFTKISYASAIVATEPILTVILAYFFLKKQEEIGRFITFSIILVFIGIVIMSLSSLQSV